jgi:hypothetical protein
MNTISIALFGRRSDAEPLQKRLSAAGIPAEVHSCPSMKGARLHVAASKFEPAHELLLQWHSAEGALHDAIRCPECKSFRVDYPQYTHKSTVPNLLVSLLANIGALRKEFYCEDCHFTWPREGTKPSRVRPHMAPYYFIEGVPQAKEQAGTQRAEAQRSLPA